MSLRGRTGLVEQLTCALDLFLRLEVLRSQARDDPRTAKGKRRLDPHVGLRGGRQREVDAGHRQIQPIEQRLCLGRRRAGKASWFTPT